MYIKLYVSTFHINCICFPRGRLRAHLRHVQPGLVVCGGLALGRHLLVPLHRRLQSRGQFRLGLRSFGFSTDCDVDAPPQPAALRGWETKRVKETTSISLSTTPCLTGQVCPSLAAPENGALVCDIWLFGSFCKMFCNDEYDVRTRSDAGRAEQLFVCDIQDGIWNIPNPPDCSSEFHNYV